MEDREFVEVQDVEVHSNQSSVNFNQNASDLKKAHDYALYALIASIVGLVSGFGIVGGIVGLILGNTAKQLGDNSDMLTASKIISIIGIALGALALIFIIIWGLFIFTIGMSA